ncbi:MAG: hypothetical protein GXY08_13735, partial [Ruminococcus sp.]|nr:hypothetical protein [Ruminococcus sp.]
MKKNSRKCIRQKTLSFFVASAVGCSQVLSLIPVNTIAAEDDPAAQVSADVLYGDANNDGKVDNADAALIEKYVRYDNMHTVDSAAADVDLDGKVTLSDAELVYQLNNAQISALPYTGDITWSTYPDPANYEIINTGITWQEAENYCEDNGGHLAVITTEKEQIMIESIIKSQEARKNNYWIGLMRYNENDFDWITAESMNYTNWHPGNPGNYGVDQNAVLFYGNDFAFGEWDDISDSGNCEGSSYYGLHNFGFILEKDGTPVSDYHLWKDSTCLPTSGKYKLDCDVTASRISVKESLDLDLNGHTVSIERVNCDGDVTITDTSEEQRGAMISSSSGTLLDIDGSLTLLGGTFIGNQAGNDSATIGVNGRGCFTLDGAKVVSYSSNALSLRSSRGTTNIIRGELYTEGNHNSIPDNFSTIYMNKNYTGTLNISGGNIVSEYTSGIYCESNNGTVNISGGKIEGKARYGFYAPNGTALNLSGNCNIKGGIAGIYVPEDKKINITGNIVSFDTSVTSPVSGVITSGWAEFADAQFIPEGINGSVIVDADGELYFRSEEDDPDIPPVTTTPTTTSSTTTTTTTTTRAPFAPVTTEYNPRIEETIDEEKNERLQITGELTAKQMTPDEIESAGFDVEVPDNYHYFNYSVEFTFHDEPIIFTKYEAVPISPGNHVTTPVPKIVYPNSEPVGPGES